MNRRSFFERLAAAFAALFAPWRAQRPPRSVGAFGVGVINSRMTRLTIHRKG